ncbi:MAG: hypothetical protein LAO09_08395 [Acidobacteriia bacterium]|nr:hypothetical protein [Terriglobia bacterium]
MTIVKRIAPGSAFKVGLVVYGLLGLIAGTLCSAAAWAVPNCPLHARLPFAHGILPILPIILCPIVWGILGSVATTISAVFYNLASGWVGGLEVEIH